MGSVAEGSRRRRRKEVKDTGEGKKQRLNIKQAQQLEMSFQKERKPDSGTKEHLAAELGLDIKQVSIWFQNRRSRSKTQQLEGDFMKLKSAYDAVVMDKCLLEGEFMKLKSSHAAAENEVLRLRESLTEVEDQVKKLTVGQTDGEKNGVSPSSFVPVGIDQCQTYRKKNRCTLQKATPTTRWNGGMYNKH